MNESLPESPEYGGPLSLVAIEASGILASAVLGAVINSVNGGVSPEYFITVLRWNAVTDVWRAAIAQGIFEGLLFGAFFSTILTIGIGLISRGRCSYRLALRHLGFVLSGAFGCWIVGGLCAVILATISPEFYRHTFFGVPEELEPMRRYAWVGGSIWGVQMGGLISVTLALVVFRSRWHALHEQAPIDIESSVVS